MVARSRDEPCSIQGNARLNWLHLKVTYQQFVHVAHDAFPSDMLSYYRRCELVVRATRSHVKVCAELRLAGYSGGQEEVRCWQIEADDEARRVVVGSRVNRCPGPTRVETVL